MSLTAEQKDFLMQQYYFPSEPTDIQFDHTSRDVWCCVDGYHYAGFGKQKYVETCVYFSETPNRPAGKCFPTPHQSTLLMQYLPSVMPAGAFCTSCIVDELEVRPERCFVSWYGHDCGHCGARMFKDAELQQINDIMLHP